jgi:hypothetical protein
VTLPRIGPATDFHPEVVAEPRSADYAWAALAFVMSALLAGAFLDAV